MNQKTSKVEKEFYLRCSYLTLSVLFDKEPNLTRLNCLLTMGGVKYHPSMRSVLLSGYLAAAHADNDRNIALPYIFNTIYYI